MVIRTDPERIVAASVAITIAVLVAMAFPHNMTVMAVASAAAAILSTMLLVAIGGHTITERLRRRRMFRRPVRSRNLLYSQSGAGTVWDGQSVAMYVALLPAPFQVSVVDVPDPKLAPASVPVDLIRDYLVQGDIKVAEINVLAFSYRRFGRSDYNDAYYRTVGETPLPTTVSTVIEVKVNLERSLFSVLARRPQGGSTPAALGSTVKVVAARLERALNIEGYEARLMKGAEVAAFHASMLSSLNDALHHEEWDHLGGDTPAVVVRPQEWTPRAAQRWWQVRADRVAAGFSIRAGRYTTDVVRGALAYCYPDAAKFPEKAQYLRRANGNQGNAVTEMLPLAATVPGVQVDDSLELGQAEPFPFSIPAAGLGIYLGDSLDEEGGRVFVNMQTGGEVLYVQAPASFLACLIARASAVGATVGLRLGGDAWANLAATVNPALISVSPRLTQALEVYEGAAPENVLGRSAVVVWCPEGIPSSAVYSLIMEADYTARIATPDGIADFEWSLSTEERDRLSTPASAVAAVTG